jgi:hypothetical protein
MTHKKRRHQAQNTTPQPDQDPQTAPVGKVKRKKKADADRNDDASGYSSSSK